MANTVEVDDVQALVFSAHGKLPRAMAVGLAVQDQTAARAGLRLLVEQQPLSWGLGSGAGQTRATALQIALSAAGMHALGARPEELGLLSRPFRQGVLVPHRSRALGDVERNAPPKWTWSDQQTHMLLLVYGTESTDVEAHCEELLEQLALGWSCISRIPVRVPPTGREPFGFRDGMARTRVDISDVETADSDVELLPPGEVLLGHRTATGLVTPAPALGLNSSYLVVRQLEQDVKTFWNYWMSQGSSEEESIWLAAKAVGRWPNGMPVSGSAPRPQPAYDDTIARGTLSFRDDPLGEQCPLGAHIRRANPRDGMGVGPEVSRAITDQHRILRRGRVYGTPAPSDWLPRSIALDTEPSDSVSATTGERGLLFMCLCADIEQQFEFIQQTWLNNSKHAGLFAEVDPIAAGGGLADDRQRFTIPRDALRRRIGGIPATVTVRGAGYFLLPGRSALLALLDR